MIGQVLLPIIVALGIFMGKAGAMPQSVGPDEARNAHAFMVQSLALNALQKSAIYCAVLHQWW